MFYVIICNILISLVHNTSYIMHTLLHARTCKVLKQAMRASGGNLTETHIEELSLCALFLMSAAKKVDQELGCHQSTAHTIRDANKDISKMMKVLLEKSVSSHVSECNTVADPGFLEGG